MISNFKLKKIVSIASFVVAGLYAILTINGIVYDTSSMLSTLCHFINSLIWEGVGFIWLMCALLDKEEL